MNMSTNLIIHRIPLRDQHAIDPSSVARATGSGGEVFQRTVEFRQLVNGFIAHKRLADKDDLVRVVDGDEFCEGAHEGLCDKRK